MKSVMYQLVGAAMDQGVSQRELSRRSKVSFPSVCRYFNAVRTPSITKVEQMADAIGMKLVLVKKEDKQDAK